MLYLYLSKAKHLSLVLGKSKNVVSKDIFLFMDKPEKIIHNY